MGCYTNSLLAVVGFFVLVTLAVVSADGVTLAVDMLVGSLETGLSSQLEELDDGECLFEAFPFLLDNLTLCGED